MLGFDRVHFKIETKTLELIFLAKFSLDINFLYNQTPPKYRTDSKFQLFLMQRCKNCNSKSLVHDDITYSLVCSSCGVVQSFDNLQAHIGGISGPKGTFIHTGTVGSGALYNYKDRKILDAQRIIDETMAMLGIPPSKSNEVKTMISNITEDEYGQGNWFPKLVGACSYVVMRNGNRSLAMAEVASAVGCDVHELGRMINRVVEFLDLKLPEFDIVSSFERAIRNSSSLSGVSKEKKERMTKQGVFLVQCAVKWFLTTGRRPLPMVAAVLVFVAKVNQIEVKIEDVSMEVNAAAATSKLRYKELLGVLVKAAQALPWGKDVTVKNVVKNAPFVLQYMEMKSRAKPGAKKRKELEGFDMEDVVSECLSKDFTYGNDVENDSQYFELENRNGFGGSSVDDIQNVKISHECLSFVYSKLRDEVGYIKAMEENGENERIKKGSGYELNASDDWWTGQSALSKKLLLKQILEKNVGLDVMPPSFVTGGMVYEKRRRKIKAAKLRIDKIMHPSKTDSGNADIINSSECVKARKKRRKRHVAGIDWEDFIIETLLLHQVKEDEIEKGHYNTLLDLHVFNSGIM